jgi:hypothetical protein
MEMSMDDDYCCCYDDDDDYDTMTTTMITLYDYCFCMVGVWPGI